MYIGRVQGVGFRATAAKIAEGFPITGWVRNEPDRSVLLEVQGTQADIDAFLAALRAAMGRKIQSEISGPIPDLTGEHAEHAFVIAG